MDQTYWVIEFIKVLLGYMFITYLWPAVVFRKHLSGKSRAYRFCFCVNISILLSTTGVLFLGLIHLLFQPLVAVIFWGVFLVQLFRNYDFGLSQFKNIRLVFNKTMTVRRLLLRWFTVIGGNFKSAVSGWWRSTKGRRIEYALLLVIVAFATAYFSSTSLQVHCYGASDQYVHHAWVYGLEQGNIFSKGIYPEGMHCFIYLTGTVLPIGFYSIMLFLAGAYIQVFIVSAYLLGRMLFGWRMSGMLAIMGFLTIEQVAAIGVTGISRLTWTLPQEFAMYAVFMTSYALIGFLRQKPQPKPDKKQSRKFRLPKIKGRLRSFSWRKLIRLSTWKRILHIPFWRRFFSDRYLFIFITAIAVTICVHFYATIMTIFPCVVIVLVYVPRLLRRGVLKRLIAGALIALMIAATPMVVAFAEGYPLQGSLYWAMNVTNKSLGNEEITKPGSGTTDTAETTTIAETTVPVETTVPADVQSDAEKPSLKERIKGKIYEIVDKNFCELYGDERGWLMFYAGVAIIGLAAILLFINGLIGLIRRRLKKKPLKYLFRSPEGYLIAAFSVFFLLIMYKPKVIGLPSLIAGDRLCAIIDMFGMLMFACFLDVFLCLVRPLLRERFIKPLSVIACAGIYVFAQMSGLYHGYPYSMLTRYPVAIELTKEIVNNTPNFKYTIISTTDELYQVIEDGYHEEWIDFIEKRSKATYTIPTPYLFFFIEKHPLRYAQYNCSSGPEWLATEKYASLFNSSIGAQYPDILHGQISEEGAAKPLTYGKKRSDTASNPEKRVILESKAYQWYEKFSEMYPNDGEVIYEDEDYICYCVHQNEFSLFSLGIMKN